jgi:hypothetical protein
MGGRAGSVGMRVSGKRSSAYRPRSIRVQAATPQPGARDGDDMPTPVASTHAGAGATELRAKPSDASLAPTAVGAGDDEKRDAPRTAIFIPLFKGAAGMEKRRQQRSHTLSAHVHSLRSLQTHPRRTRCCRTLGCGRQCRASLRLPPYAPVLTEQLTPLQWLLMNQEGTPVNNFGAGCQSSSNAAATYVLPSLLRRPLIRRAQCVTPRDTLSCAHVHRRAHICADRRAHVTRGRGG